MANKRWRKEGDSDIPAVLYAVIILVLIAGMGYLFYYSRSQAKERQDYIRELESKEAATKGQYELELLTEEETEETEETKETEEETESETQSEEETFSSEAESESDIKENVQANVQVNAQVDVQRNVQEDPVIMILNGTGKSGVAAYWKRILNEKGLTHIVMADYKGSVAAHTVIYLKNGGDAPKALSQCFPSAEYLAGELKESITVADGQDEYDSYNIWVVVGKDDALHD